VRSSELIVTYIVQGENWIIKTVKHFHIQQRNGKIRNEDDSKREEGKISSKAQKENTNRDAPKLPTLTINT